MCIAMLKNGAFDPSLCPILKGVPPEEIPDRLAKDPQIRACRMAFEAFEKDQKHSEDLCIHAMQAAKSARQATRQTGKLSD